MKETRDEELLRLRRFKDRVFSTIDKYVDYIASPNQCDILRDLRAELWERQ
jgi:hypothetical protein